MGVSAKPLPVARVFGERVRARRKALGWSLEQLGEHAGMHWTYVGSVERGERNISLLNIVRIAAALEVDAGELMQSLRP
jgi:transcriptional regulator with XRE-family HTH domain